MKSSAKTLRSWVDGQRAAQQRAAVERRSGGQDSISVSFELADFAASLLGWPLPEDSYRMREIAQVRASWAKIRRRHVA